MLLVAKDCMSKSIKSIAPDENAKKALEILLASGMSGLPVLNKRGAVVGVFTEKEILIAVLPAYIGKVGSFIYGEDSKSVLKRMSGLDKFLVKDIMRKEVQAVEEETSLSEVSRIMLSNNERRVVVIKGGKAIGIITRCDVVRALAKNAETLQ
jgi:CBS domain-containing protein